MEKIKEGLEDISGKVSGLSFDAAMIIAKEKGVNHPQSESRDTTKERKQLKENIDGLIEQLQRLKNSF